MKKQNFKFLFALLILFILADIILVIIMFTNKAHAASWDTAGNNVTANDWIGTTNYLPLKIKTNNVDRISVNVDGFRFWTPTFYITNSNGQYVMGHNSATGCTTIFGQVSNMINMCNNRVEVLGAPLVAKTSYRITSGADIVTATDYTIESTGGDEQLPLSTAGKHYEFINTGEGELMIHAQGGQLIGNKNPEEMYRVMGGESVTLVGNGTGWRIIANKI